MNLNSILTTNYSDIRENRINNVLTPSQSVTELSYMEETLNFLSEYKKEVRNCKYKFYNSISESASQEVLTESFSDLFESFKKMIKKFLEFIKSLFNRFIASLHKLVGSDKYITKHKDKFKDFKSDYEFDIEGYTYTFDSNVPLIEVQAKFDKDFVCLDFTDSSKFGSTANDKQNALLNFITSKYDDYTDNAENDLSEFRGKVLGKTTSIDADEYAEELFKVFRDDTDIKDTITVTYSVVSEALIRFKNYKETEKEIKKTKDKIDREYEQVKKKIEKLVRRDTTKGANDTIKLVIDDDYNGSSSNVYVTNEVRNKIDLYIKAVCDRVIEYSSIHSLAFSAKLDAVKDRTNQDKKILYGALNAIYKNGYKEEFK